MKSVSMGDIRDRRLHSEDQAVLSPIEEILEDMKLGKPVIIVDDEDRENEGDLVIAAEKATPESINFMAREGRGLICLPMKRAMVERLGLELMGRGDNSRHKTAFTVSIEAREGVTTGISAADRAKTIQTAIDPETGPHDIATPGHVFPLLARDGGVLVRAGHTEAAVDLAKMAGFSGAGVVCEIMNDDGTMARLPNLLAFAQKHGLKLGTIADLIAYRRRTESLIKKIHEAPFKSRYGGDFTMRVYATTVHYAEHVALIKGDIKSSKDPVLVRMHSVDLFEDILGGASHSTLHRAMEMIGRAGCGVIVILRPPKPKVLFGTSKTRQDKGKTKDDGAQALRDYGVGAQILRDIGVRKMTLLSNTPKNVIGLDGYDLQIEDYRPIK